MLHQVLSPCTLAGQNLTTTAQNGWTISIAAATAAPSTTAGATTAPAGTAAAGTLTYTLAKPQMLLLYNTLTLTRATTGAWGCSAGTTTPYASLC